MRKNVIYDEAKKQFALEENNGGGNSVTWTTIEGKPAFIAEGANAAAARTALGLGTAATTASTAYATAAQGVLANTATQPNDLGELGTKDAIAVPADITATGTASATTYLRGDGSWATPTNTTYTVINEDEFNTGTASTTRAINAVSLNRDIQKKINDFIPNPPETGTYILKSVDGVLSWIEDI